MRVVSVIGRPGTGKTHLLRSWMDLVDDWEPFTAKSLVRGHYSPSRDVHVLGTYEPGQVFAGTDRLSMACQSHVLKWMAINAPAAVLMEGDRLANATFFDALCYAGNADLSILVLAAPELELLVRYAERGSKQPEQFLKSRQTKVENVATRYEPLATRLDHVTQADTVSIMRALDALLA